jgi:uncharacterized protein (UPF0264 family)
VIASKSLDRRSSVPQLLVSVRNADEAVAALAGGADVIDVKEPRRGPLGRAKRSTLQQVISRADRAAPVSVALGELQEFEPRYAANLPVGVGLAKLGLARCRDWPIWSTRWSQAIDALPGGVAPVAVVYADAAKCAAPPPHLVIGHAAQVGCRAVLFDTYEKSSGNLFDALPGAKLSSYIAEIRELNMIVALAGSLDEQSVPIAASYAPDVIAVRSAACRDGRHGVVEQEKVRCLAQLIRGTA